MSDRNGAPGPAAQADELGEQSAMTDLKGPVEEVVDGSALARTGTRSIAVVGCGDWGKNLVRVFAELGALAAVCDIDNAKAEAQAQTRGVPALE